MRLEIVQRRKLLFSGFRNRKHCERIAILGMVVESTVVSLNAPASPSQNACENAADVRAACAVQRVAAEVSPIQDAICTACFRA